MTCFCWNPLRDCSRCRAPQEWFSPWVPPVRKPTYVMVQEDTAGNRYCSEFEVNGGTAPIRSWVERPQLSGLP
jgi:hypothetical protein